MPRPTLLDCDYGMGNMIGRGVKNMKSKTKSTFIEVRCPVETNVLHIIRNFVCSIAREMGFSPEDIAKIEISVDEACSNVIRHAYTHLLLQRSLSRNAERQENQRVEQSPRAGATPLIKLEVETGQNHLQIKIIDSGVGDKAGPHKGVHNLDEYVEVRHGLGTYIINKFMDKVKIYFPQECGTTVSMVKFLERKAAE